MQNRNNNQRLKIFAAVSGVASVLAILGVVLFGNVLPGRESRASGVTPTITPSTQNVATAASITVSFTNTATLTSGATLQFTRPTAYSGTLSTANTTVNGVAPSNVTNTVSGSNTISTITIANPSISAGSGVTVATTALTTPNSAGNYTFSVESPTGNDYGANFQYVGQANVVQVRAFIPISLAFDIRNTADTANTNTCDLGTASTTAVSSCAYRLKVTTNAANGYTVAMQASGNLTDGGSNSIANAVAGSGGSGGTNIVAGTERYGVVLTPGSITGSGGTATLSSIFNAGATNSVLYNYTSPNVILTTNKPNSPAPSGDTTNTTLVTHNLGIDANTPSGTYTQTITYTVAPAF